MLAGIHNHRAWSLPCVRQAARMMVRIRASFAAAVSIGAMVTKTNALLARLRGHEVVTWIIRMKPRNHRRSVTSHTGSFQKHFS